MRTIQLGHEIFSLFGVNLKNPALTKDNSKLLVVKSLVSAFLFALILGMALGLINLVLTKNSSTFHQETQIEAVAYTPGQFVTNIIRGGYLPN